MDEEPLSNLGLLSEHGQPVDCRAVSHQALLDLPTPERNVAGCTFRDHTVNKFQSRFLRIAEAGFFETAASAVSGDVCAWDAA